MNEPDQDNRNAPTYLAHYGMQRPPFAVKAEDDMYYAEPTRTQRLDILLHLTQYGHETLLVTGPEGSGKTTMLHQFLKKAPDTWKICAINAHPMMDQEQLVYRICHGFNFSVDGPDTATAIVNLKRRIDAMLVNKETVAIIIDNAHILSTSALAFLVEMAKVRNIKTGIHLRIILFCEPQIKIQFASAELESNKKNAYRKIDLPPLSEEQTGKLIQFRTKTAGLIANNTFTEAAINKIYKQSKGLPGEIVELAHRVLFEMTPLKRRTKPKASHERKPRGQKNSLKIVGIVFAVAIVALLLNFQKEINQLYSSKPQMEQESTEQTVQSLLLPQQTDETGEEEWVAESSEEPATIVTDGADNEDFVAPADSEETATPLIDTQPPPKPEPPPAPTPSPPPPPMDTGQNLVRSINQEQWILEQNANHFTIQLLAGYQKSTINNFLTKNRLPATELAYYFSLNKGKNWHSLLYGVYPDYRSAMQAISLLPKNIRKTKPWIRQLKSIQSDINYALEHKNKP